MAKIRSQQSASIRRWQDDREAILEFNRSITLIVDPSALTASIAARLAERFHADRIILLRAAPDSLLLEVAFSSGYDSDDLKTIRLSRQDRMVKWMLTNESLLKVGSDPGVLNYLSEAERSMLARFDIRVCAPLVALNHLTGLILLSSTQKDWSLSAEDSSLLEMLTSQAGIAFENAYLAEQQRDRLRRLYRAERLATAGQLASSVAHEIRNPLTSIRSTVQYLLGEFPEDHPKRSLIEGVILEVDRINRTVDGLLNLTRQIEFKPEKIALDEIISETLLLVSTQARNQGVEILFPKAAIMHILGDASRLKQLFLNLILNSLQAMTAGGRLDIELTQDSHHAQVSIKDTGCGIAAENLDKVFDPFFTTRQGGTGLGLPISYTIARQHGGEMEIKSHPNEGTTVAIRFPLVK